MSSANKRWDTITDGPAVLPTEKAENFPVKAATSNIQLNASITISNNNGDNGSLCRSPLELPKKSDGLSLIRMENFTVEMQYLIHFLHFSEKQQRWSIYIKKSQLTWSYAFPTSNLHNTLRTPDFNLLSIHLEAIKTESKICLPFTKAFCESEISPCATLRS